MKLRQLYVDDWRRVLPSRLQGTLLSELPKDIWAADDLPRYTKPCLSIEVEVLERCVFEATLFARVFV